MSLSDFRVVSVSMSPNADAVIRRCTRVLSMVHELHKVGYQRLRIAPFIHDIGTWRCPVTFLGNVKPEDNMPINWDFDTAPQYSSAAEEDYFDWKDAKGLDARHLAARFLELFPKVSEQAVGLDWAYAGWLTSVLGMAESTGSLPLLRGHDVAGKLAIRVPNPPFPAR